MSLVLKTVRAFPRGRTTEQILVLVGAGFAHDKRVSALAELDRLHAEGFVNKGRDGKWTPLFKHKPEMAKALAKKTIAPETNSEELLTAALATFSSETIPEIKPETSTDAEVMDPQALIRYWRSALRADPRGATTQVADKHGIEWSLISGRGRFKCGAGRKMVIRIDLSSLNPAFQEALVRREGHENVLAVGWPMAVGRNVGVPTIQPVGLFAAEWHRNVETLELTVDSDDVLVNPEWIRSAARASGWSHDDLADLFHAGDGIGLPFDEFSEKVRSAVASQIRGRIIGEDLEAQLDVSSQGIYDSAAIFLPSDSTFTAGASKDFDVISSWPEQRISRTALGAVLGLNDTGAHREIAAINTAPLNKEQLRAVKSACDAPVTVVTGPPGTGKSQAIVSMVASVLAANGRVLVASKNHQALDAVEERLCGLAEDVPFAVRTLNPLNDVDTSFLDSLRSLLENESAPATNRMDNVLLAQLADLSTQRYAALQTSEDIARLECRIADVLERIDLRKEHARFGTSDQTDVDTSRGLARRLLDWLIAKIARRVPSESMEKLPSLDGMSLRGLELELSKLRKECAALGTPADTIELGDRIQKLAESLLPTILSHTAHLSAQARAEISEEFDNWQFTGKRGQPPTDLAKAVLDHRPLWLASILGAPRRIPLDDGLFDLVVFDEASQCDIATAIPLFARAKRVVIVGDDRQLTFIPQLGQAQDRNLMQAQGLPVEKMGRYAQSRRSLFDFASRLPNAVRVTLRHQYRSAGPIVDYISESFYQGQLQSACDPACLTVPTNSRPGIAWEDVPSPVLPQSGNMNSAEVKAIAKHLKSILVDEGYTGSVGVISPFRSQVLALQKAIDGSIPEPILKSSEVKIGTVDGFQGQERDLILFSPCLGPRSPASGLTFFNRDSRRLNVAISRARAVALIFGDLKFARSGQSKALRRLASFATEPKPKRGEGVFDSDWERKVYHALKARGLSPEPQHEVAGRRLDFALFGENGVKLDLEVDGRRWHQSQDGRRKTSDLWRDHQMKSLGWRVRRFWVDELSKDMEKCIDRVEQDLS